MTVRGLLLAVVLMAAQPVEAAHGRCYSRWYYPWPQRCGHIRSLAVVASTSEERRGGIRDARSRPTDIPLPALDRADFTVAEPDAVTRARLQLLGYAYGH